MGESSLVSWKPEPSAKKCWFNPPGNSHSDVSSKQQPHPAPFLGLGQCLPPPAMMTGEETVFRYFRIRDPEKTFRLFVQGAKELSVSLCLEERKKITPMIQEKNGWSDPFPFLHINYTSWFEPPHLLRSGTVVSCETLYQSDTLPRPAAAKGQKEGSFPFKSPGIFGWDNITEWNVSPPISSVFGSLCNSNPLRSRRPFWSYFKRAVECGDIVTLDKSTPSPVSVLPFQTCGKCTGISQGFRPESFLKSWSWFQSLAWCPVLKGT